MRGLIRSLIVGLVLVSPLRAQTVVSVANASIIVPTLPADADKQALLQAYYQITGQAMFDRLLPSLSSVTERDRQRYANCPAALQVLETFAEHGMKPHFARWIDQEVSPILLKMLDEGLSEADLRAFLRFSATADGQRHLRALVNRTGDDDLSKYPAYKRDPALRQYSAHLDALPPPEKSMRAAMPSLMTSELVAMMQDAKLRSKQAATDCAKRARD